MASPGQAPLTEDQLAEAFEMAEYVEQRKSEVDRQLASCKQKEDNYKKLMTKLSMLSENATKSEMVPVCNGLAYFDASITNTNRVTVLLGDNWFAERSVDQAMGVAKRRMNFISEEEQRLTTEQADLSGKLDLIIRSTEESQFAEMTAQSQKLGAAGPAPTAKKAPPPPQHAAATKDPKEAPKAEKKVTLVEPTAATVGGAPTTDSELALGLVAGNVFGNELPGDEEEDEDEDGLGGLTVDEIVELEAELDAAGSTDLSDEDIDALIMQRIAEKKAQKKALAALGEGAILEKSVPPTANSTNPKPQDTATKKVGDPLTGTPKAQQQKQTQPNMLQSPSLRQEETQVSQNQPAPVHVDPKPKASPPSSAPVTNSTSSSVGVKSDPASSIVKEAVISDTITERAGVAPTTTATTSATATKPKKKSQFRMEEM